MAETNVKNKKNVGRVMHLETSPVRLTDGIIVKEVNVENKSIEELEKELEEQKSTQALLVKKINEQGFKAEGDWKKFLDFKNNINLIYLKIKELKKTGN